MMHKAWRGIEEVPYWFLGHPSNFKVTLAEKSLIWIQFEITRLVTAIKSLRFALLFIYLFLYTTVVFGPKITQYCQLYKVERGYTGFTLSVHSPICLSVHPYACSSICGGNSVCPVCSVSSTILTGVIHVLGVWGVCQTDLFYFASHLWKWYWVWSQGR